MPEIKINYRSTVPVYKQIIDQIKMLIAGRRFKTGQQLPPIRKLAEKLKINPATVARSYQELEREGVLGGSRRRGTIVLGEDDNPQRISLRQSRLNDMIDNLIINALSQGYHDFELEDSFRVQLNSWRTQRANK
jgi:GntR family transcriptional regulator